MVKEGGERVRFGVLGLLEESSLVDIKGGWGRRKGLTGGRRQGNEAVAGAMGHRWAADR
jgi:hypothetical protein